MSKFLEALHKLGVPEIIGTPEDPQLQARRDSGHADKMPIRDFEELFAITEVDVPEGYVSDYYRIPSPQERERNRVRLETFLNEGQPTDLPGE